MRPSTVRAWIQSALLMGLAACGGDGGIGGTGGGGGAFSADVSVGTITAFGSVWVNGVKFESSTATIKIDDNPHPESDLRIGMVARVDGSITNASATSISVESAVKGRVESVTGTAQMVVMGQAVFIDSATRFENGLRPTAGDYVEVHGLVVADGQISAGFVERKSTPADPPFVVHGIVRNHAAGGTSFTIGTLSVTLGAGALINDMPGGSWNGLQVEVKGSTCAGTPPAAACGTLTAGKVEPDGPQGNIAKIELEGFVTQLNANGFNLGAQPVVTTGAVFVGGLSSEVVVGSKLEVEGALSGGILTATKVSLRENIRFEANIASIAGTSLTLQGLPGITVETNSLTQFKNRPLNQLAVNNNLRIRGRPGSGNTVIATEVEHRSDQPDSRVILQAVASAVATPNVTLLGMVVDTTNIPDGEFKDANDTVISRTAFFAQAAPGKLIKARGTLSGTNVVFGAQDGQIELED